MNIRLELLFFTATSKPAVGAAGPVLFPTVKQPVAETSI
jgi:hypothetical protein